MSPTTGRGVLHNFMRGCNNAGFPHVQTPTFFGVMMMSVCLTSVYFATKSAKYQELEIDALRFLLRASFVLLYCFTPFLAFAVVPSVLCPLRLEPIPHSKGKKRILGCSSELKNIGGNSSSDERVEQQPGWDHAESREKVCCLCQQWTKVQLYQVTSRGILYFIHNMLHP